MLNRSLLRGWHAWHALHAEVERKQTSMACGLRHMLNRKLSAGWGSWREMVAEHARFLQLARRGLAFFVTTRALKTHLQSNNIPWRTDRSLRFPRRSRIFRPRRRCTCDERSESQRRCRL